MRNAGEAGAGHRWVIGLGLSAAMLIAACARKPPAPDDRVEQISSALEATVVVLQPSSQDGTTPPSPFCGPPIQLGPAVDVFDLGKGACPTVIPVVQFDLSPLAGVPASRVSAARLELFQENSQVVSGPWFDFQAAAYPVRGTWSEDSLHFVPPFESSATYNNHVTITQATGAWVSWDVTKVVQEWVTNGHPNQGFAIAAIPDNHTSSLLASFASRENTDAAHRPRLVVTADPFVSGAACSKDSDCGGGFCTDGVCCSSRCSDRACGRCDLPGSRGICAPAPGGTTPALDCGAYLCDGQTTGCSTSCGSSIDCAGGVACVGQASRSPIPLRTTA